MAYITGNKSALKKKTKNNDKFITNPISLTNLIKFIQYTFSNNKVISKRSLINLNKYLDCINEEAAYDDNYNSLYYFRFLHEILKLKVEKNLEININNWQLVEDYLSENVKEDFIPDSVIDECYNTICELSIQEMTDAEVVYLSEWIQNKLSYSAVYSRVDEIQDIINEIKADSKINNADLVKRMTSTFNVICKELSRAESVSTASNQDFSTANISSLKSSIKYMYDRQKDPSTKLKTGFKMLNQMLNGGFESSRQYIFMGIPKAFKSGTLLNMVLSMVSNNPNIQTKDPNKKATIVYLTMENTVEETNERIYSYLTGENDVGKSYSQEEIINSIVELTKKNNIHIRVLYRAHRSVSTDYLYQIIEDMELEGEECICMVQDYTKRIRSTVNNPDIRLELGEVVNEFSVFAKKYNIPLITAAQLNRTAMNAIESVKAEKGKDAGKILSMNQIGESTLIIENTDVAILVNREDDTEMNESYLTFKMAVNRGKYVEGSPLYFAQPFENGFKIKEDEGTDETFGVESIGSSITKEDKERIETINQSRIKNLGGNSSFSNSKQINKSPRTANKAIKKTSKLTEENVLEDIDDLD